MPEITFHPLANIFPLIDGAEFDALVEDIKVNGLYDPIALCDGKILDGRNRYRACLEAGAEIRTVSYEGENPLAFVISKNLKRRHLSESQRAMVADRIAALPDGVRQVGKFADVPTQAESARIMNVSERSVRTARKVRKNGVPELAAAVDRGEISVSAAAEVSIHPAEVQKEIVNSGDVKKAAKQVAVRVKMIPKKHEDIIVHVVGNDKSPEEAAEERKAHYADE
jgi:ParB-like chromosome segregation protein Spo0J